MLFAKTQNMPLILPQKALSNCLLFPLQNPHKDLLDNHMQNVVIGVQNHQIPQKADQSFINEPTTSILQDQAE